MFLKSSDRGYFPLPPVVSKIVKDRKAHSDLQVIKRVVYEPLGEIC